MPDEAVDEGAFIAQFMAEEGLKTQAPAEKGEEVTDESTGDSSDEGEGKAGADDAGGQGEGDEDKDKDKGEGEGEGEGQEPAVPANLQALNKAIEAGDTKAFLDALGAEAAEKLLGAKAHKALRLAHAEVKKTEQRANRVTAALIAKYGDPIAVRKAIEAGDPNAADMFVDSIEKQFGAAWADCIKFVNASFAGKPARLETKAKEAKQADEAAKAQQKAAETKVRNSITETVKSADAKLLKEYPNVVNLVFEALRAGYNNGVKTPKKALEVVKKDLEAQYAALSRIFEKPAAKPRVQLRPPRETHSDSGGKSREMSEEEFRQQFLREQGLLR